MLFLTIICVRFVVARCLCLTDVSEIPKGQLVFTSLKMKVREAGCLDQTNLSTLCPLSVSAVWLTQTDQSPLRDHGCLSLDSPYCQVFMQGGYWIVVCKSWSYPFGPFRMNIWYKEDNKIVKKMSEVFLQNLGCQACDEGVIVAARMLLWLLKCSECFL